MEEPSADHRRLLNAIWDAFRRESEWPRFVGIDQVMDRQGLIARDLILSMPPGLMVPDVPNMSQVWWPNANDELRVKTAGLRYCDDTERELELLARVAHYLADRERTHTFSSLSEPSPVRVTSAEAQRDLNLTNAQTDLAYDLLMQFETALWTGASGSATEWSLDLDTERVRRYRDVTSVDSYLAARAELDRPRRPLLSPLPEFIEVTEAPTPNSPTIGDQSRPQRPRWLRVSSPVLNNPIVAGLIVTVVGGLILAALLHWLG